MPIEYNEILATLMENRPEFATEIYNQSGGPDLPDYDSISIRRQTLPRPDRPDSIRVCALAAYSKDGERIFAILFDAAITPNQAQAESWLEFITAAQRALSCMVAFVVLCRDARVAEWALACSTVGDMGYVLPVVIPSLLANA